MGMTVAVRECRTGAEVLENVRRTNNYFRKLEPSWSEKLRAVNHELEIIKCERDQYRAKCQDLTEKLRNSENKHTIVLKGPVTIEKVRLVMCEHFNISLDELTSLSRHVDYLMARQMGMYLCRLLTRESCPTIARAFARADHTSVIYAEKKLVTLRATNREVNELAEILIEEIKARKDADATADA
jgi:chromosomal replication initiation ATPase DnaA